jgi:hypothetical protein
VFHCAVVVWVQAGSGEGSNALYFSNGICRRRSEPSQKSQFPFSFPEVERPTIMFKHKRTITASFYKFRTLGHPVVFLNQLNGPLNLICVTCIFADKVYFYEYGRILRCSYV